MFNLPLKRRRDDGLLADENPSHDKKKPRSLILRSLHDSGSFHENSQFAPKFRPPALTPVESSDDDDDGAHSCNRSVNSTHLVPESSHVPQHPHFMFGPAMNLDARRKTHSLPSGDNLSPWPVTATSNGSVQPSPIPHDLVNQSLNITAPACGTFPGGPQSASTMEIEPVQHTGPLVSNSPDSERTDDTARWYRRRLPSPISDDGDSFAKSSKASMSDAEMAYTTSQPVSPPPLESYQFIDTIQQDESPFIDYTKSANQPSCPSSASPAKKKATFSMGYRADCDKCRDKVLGHYSHIIRA